LSSAFRDVWLTSGLVALDKGNGKPRPIVFQESLLKLATGCVVDTSAGALSGAAGDWQRGVYHPGGTVQLVWDLRQAMRDRPDHIFTGIDCRNAFGEAARAPAMRTADVCCPQFGRLLHNLWDDSRLCLFLPSGPDAVDEVCVQDGFVQGGCEAAPAFALCLHSAVCRFLQEAQAKGQDCRVLAYMDDLYLECPPDPWRVLMNSLCSHLQSVG